MKTLDEIGNRFDAAMSHIDPEMWWKAVFADLDHLNRTMSPNLAESIAELPLFEWGRCNRLLRRGSNKSLYSGARPVSA